MCSIGVIVLCTFVMEVPAELKVWPVREANLDNTTLEMSTFRFSKGVHVPRPNVPLRFGMPQAPPIPSRQWMLPWNLQISARGTGAAARLVAMAEAEAPKTKEGAAEAPKASEGPRLNVFGEELQGCAAEGQKGDLCNYPTELCIRTGKITMRFQCKSIWEADWKSFKSVDGKLKSEQKPQAGDTTVCAAVPSEVLDSQYSKDEWGNIELGSKLPTFLKSGGKDGVRISDKGLRFRKSIDFICETCALYAGSESAGAALRNKCTALGWSSEVGAKAPTKSGAAEMETLVESAPHIFSNVAVLLIGLFAGSGITLKVLSFHRDATTNAKA